MADKTKKEDKDLQNIFDDKRFFTMDGEKYYIDNADIDSVRQADWHYSKTYNEALLAGVTTMAQMQDILEERDIVGKSYEKKRLELINSLDEKIAELNSTKDITEKRKLADAVEDLRNKLFRHNQRSSSPMSNSTEQLAEDARIEYLTSAMVKDSDGDQVWESYEDYKTTKKPGLAMRARYEVMLALQGLDSDFLDKTPEAIARKEIEKEEHKLLEGNKDTDKVKEEKPKKKK
jgi:hypothetical protein